MRPEIAKGGGLKVSERCGYPPERRFVQVLVKITKKFGPMGGGGSDPHIPPPLATPLPGTLKTCGNCQVCFNEKIYHFKKTSNLPLFQTLYSSQRSNFNFIWVHVRQLLLSYCPSSFRSLPVYLALTVECNVKIITWQSSTVHCHYKIYFDSLYCRP